MSSEREFSPIKEFGVGQNIRGVKFVETVTVTEGVICNTYTFQNDLSRDLGIINIQPGQATPSQEVVAGEKTIEGHMTGDGILTVMREGKYRHVFVVEDKYIGRLNVEVNKGDVMQWRASDNSTLTVFEICHPPYEEGRFKNQE